MCASLRFPTSVSTSQPQVCRVEQTLELSVDLVLLLLSARLADACPWETFSHILFLVLLLHLFLKLLYWLLQILNLVLRSLQVFLAGELFLLKQFLHSVRALLAGNPLLSQQFLHSRGTHFLCHLFLLKQLRQSRWTFPEGDLLRLLQQFLHSHWILLVGDLFRRLQRFPHLRWTLLAGASLLGKGYHDQLLS